ncbi:hypothetical protein [Catellatospora sichuanensis]|uniref:hypothetical protein n=1 Tax=Catellatospora sichuanensis TaxID=1969805 RepID=UPI001642C5C4|nr:hypothetical protein [Catellatospora sichuanensis]
MHLRDLLGKSGTAGDCARSAVFLPETLSASEAMRRLRAQREGVASADRGNGTDKRQA